MKIEFTGLPIILFITFMVLKLCEIIDWSWYIVTMPLWLLPLMAFVGVGIALFFSFLAVIVEKLSAK